MHRSRDKLVHYSVRAFKLNLHPFADRLSLWCAQRCRLRLEIFKSGTNAICQECDGVHQPRQAKHDQVPLSILLTATPHTSLQTHDGPHGIYSKVRTDTRCIVQASVRSDTGRLASS